MTGHELAAIARDAIPPVGATSAVATVVHRAGGRPGTGSTRYQAMWFDGRRRLAPLGPAFEQQRDMFRIVDIVNGVDRPAPRSGHRDLAGLGADSRDTGAPSEAPAGQASSPGGETAAGASRDCDGCGRPLPPGSRPNRRTHGPACRVAAHRRRSATSQEPGRPADSGSSSDVDAGITPVTLSGPSDAAETTRGAAVVAVEPLSKPLARTSRTKAGTPDPVSSDGVEKARALGSTSSREPRSTVPEEPIGPPPPGP